MSDMQLLTSLSRYYGGVDYVRGGGGNTSVKDGTYVWVKPSGTTLATIESNDFVKLDRKKLFELDNLNLQQDVAEREEQVQQIMASAKVDKAAGRPSVEAPLHNLLNGKFIVHTHPALVNGMLCSKNGKNACNELFPDALWIDYIDPGFTLYKHLSGKIEAVAKNGGQPKIIFLKNHGVFVSADSSDEINDIYGRIFEKLTTVYKNAGISTELQTGSLPEQGILEKAIDMLRSVYPDKSIYIAQSGDFDIANGPLSPDHIVYAGSYALENEPSEQTIADHMNKFKTPPRVIAFSGAVFGIGKTQKKAELVLELAKDAALVKQLTQAFGGVEYMTEKARNFIENWEVEVYRSKQV